MIPAWVLVGSALGGLARYWVGLAMAAAVGAAFPWGTLLINVLGSFVIGLAGAATAPGGAWAALPATALGGTAELRAFVMVGLCGGFTTFSAFSLQSLELLQAGRQGPALAYMLGSVVLCVLAVWAGWMLGQR